MAQVLLVEDDIPIAELVAVHLQRAGHRVSVAGDGEKALELQRVCQPELILLDVMLPRIDGIAVCAAVRKRSVRQPVIVMLTARRDEADALAGFEAGADDYVRKPFSLAELMLRVDALLGLARRPLAEGAGERGGVVSDASLATGAEEGGYTQLHIDPLAQLVRVGPRTVHLTPKEFALLSYLASHEGEVVAREVLLAEVWEYHHAGYARTVDTHVMRLRKKLSRHGLRREAIHTVFGVGYRFQGAPQTAVEGGML